MPAHGPALAKVLNELNGKFKVEKAKLDALLKVRLWPAWK